MTFSGVNYPCVVLRSRVLRVLLGLVQDLHPVSRITNYEAAEFGECVNMRRVNALSYTLLEKKISNESYIRYIVVLTRTSNRIGTT